MSLFNTALTAALLLMFYLLYSKSRQLPTIEHPLEPAIEDISQQQEHKAYSQEEIDQIIKKGNDNQKDVIIYFAHHDCVSCCDFESVWVRLLSTIEHTLGIEAHKLHVDDDRKQHKFPVLRLYTKEGKQSFFYDIGTSRNLRDWLFTHSQVYQRQHQQFQLGSSCNF